MKTKPTKVSEILRSEADWAKGARAACLNAGEVDPTCLGIAIEYCYPKEEAHRLFDKIKKLTGNNWIISWNDDPSRTWADVAKVIKELDL